MTQTAAAVKVQAAYRRNKVMDELEGQGVSTAAMRNRARRRQARRDMQGMYFVLVDSIACSCVSFLTLFSFPS
jgi:hypothetical protein